MFIPVQDGSCSGFVFSEERCQTAFLQFGYHFREKYAGVQRGEIPWLCVSNRGESIPVGTRFCLQSLVRYTFCMCNWHGKSCSETERFSVSTGAQEVYKTRRSDQLPYRIFSCSNSKGVVNFFGSSLMDSFRI